MEFITNNKGGIKLCYEGFMYTKKCEFECYYIYKYLFCYLGVLHSLKVLLDYVSLFLPHMCHCITLVNALYLCFMKGNKYLVCVINLFQCQKINILFTKQLKKTRPLFSILQKPVGPCFPRPLFS